jgi:hypothetical protein
VQTWVTMSSMLGLDKTKTLSHVPNVKSKLGNTMAVTTSPAKNAITSGAGSALRDTDNVVEAIMVKVFLCVQEDNLVQVTYVLLS